MPQLLQALVQCHKANKKRAKQGYRYRDVLIRNFSMLCRDLGGKQCYEFWCTNLPMPSLSTVAAHSKEATKHVIEGEIRCEELRHYLDSQELGNEVILGEDGSRITGRIEYDPKTNQLVGFEPELDENGLPEVASFPAVSAESIEETFRTKDPSNYVYVIMAQPLSDVPAFPLCTFGTNNKFTALQVEKRWKWIMQELAKFRISVVGLSADGDPRLLCSMKRWTFGRRPLTVLPQWKSFFFAPMNLKEDVTEELAEQPMCFQDTVHTVAKLKNQLLCSRSDNNFLPMGDYVVSGTFLQILVQNESKLGHGLCMSDLTSSDKMNFRSAQKISDDRVLEALKSIPGAEATRIYLVMLRGVMDSFLEKDLKACDRVYLLWKSNIFLRLWCTWLQSQNYSTKSHFVSSNVYQCVEVNAHSLVNMIRYLRSCSKSHLFLTWRMSSQCCERHFGDARSCTTIFSTAINMSMLNFLQRSRKIERITTVRHQLNEEEGVVVPRHHKKMQDSKRSAEILQEDHLPDDQQLFEAISRAISDALSAANELGMKFHRIPNTVPFFITRTLKEIENGVEEENEESEGEDEPEEQMVTDESEEQMPTDVAEDIILQNNEESSDFPSLSSTSPFVVFQENGKRSVIKKSTLVWRLTSKNFHLSSERQERVKAAEESLRQMQLTDSPEITVCDNVHLGDWVVFTECPLPNRVYIGRTINFCYLSGAGKSRQYSELSVPVAEPEENARGIGCLGEWYTTPFEGDGKLTKFRQPHEYYNINRYVCTLPKPLSINESLSYTPEVMESIKKVHPEQGKDHQAKKTRRATAATTTCKTKEGKKNSKRSGRMLFPNSDSDSSRCSSPKRASNDLELFSPLPHSPEEGEFVLVEFQAGKKSKYYVATVLEGVDEEFDLQVSYLRRSPEGTFSVPNIPDLASVQLENVKMILPKPKCTEGSSRRLQALYKFDVSLDHLNIC